jgi:excisionase family DNA binding protein
MTQLCPKEVAALLGVSIRTAQRLMASGEIAGGRAGRKLLRSSPLAVRQYMERRSDRYRQPGADAGELYSPGADSEIAA